MADSQKSEQPTQRRLQKARDEGNFVSSRQFISGIQFLAFVSILQFLGGKWLVSMGRVMDQLLRQAFRGDMILTDWVHLLRVLMLQCGLPILAAGGALGLLSACLQLSVTKLGFSFNKLAPNFSRLNPISRIPQLWHQNLSSFVQALVLLPVCGYVVYAIVSESLDRYMLLPFKSIQAGQADVFGSLSTLLWRAAGLFFVFGCVDLLREQRRFTSGLKMSKQDIKDEHKEAEGNPQIKMRIRRIQRDLARKRMMQQVPTATAVIVNPTHFAVALRYEPETMVAPVVVAKGKDFLALRIKQMAIDNQVPLIENPPLARGLYKAVDVGQEIPPELYKAVAEILAYIFKLMHRR